MDDLELKGLLTLADHHTELIRELFADMNKIRAVVYQLEKRVKDLEGENK